MIITLLHVYITSCRFSFLQEKKVYLQEKMCTYSKVMITGKSLSFFFERKRTIMNYLLVRENKNMIHALEASAMLIFHYKGCKSLLELKPVLYKVIYLK